MSTSTYVYLLNANHPKIVAAKASPEAQTAWEEDECKLEYRPGIEVEDKTGAVEWTDEDCEGIIVDLSKLPPGVTHIKIERF